MEEFRSLATKGARNMFLIFLGILAIVIILL